MEVITFRYIYSFFLMAALTLSFIEVASANDVVESEKPYDFNNGLLDDEYIVKSKVMPESAYDNNISSYFAVNTTSVNAHYLEFRSPVHVKSIYLRAWNYVPTARGGLSLLLKDGSRFEVISKGDGFYDEYIAVDIKDVVGVSAFKKSTNDSRIYEFDLFGSYEPEGISKVTDLQGVASFNSVDLTWVNPTEDDFMGTIIKKDGKEINRLKHDVSSLVVTNLEAETSYNFEVLTFYEDGRISRPESINLETTSIPIDDTPPGSISGLTFAVSDTSVIMDWINPPDTDFDHVRIYRDSVLIKSDYKHISFTDIGLAPNTTYVYKIIAVDASGNQSKPFIQSVLTNPTVNLTPPVAPTGVNTVAGNGSGRVNWSKNTERDIAGYNVYIDGVKYNAVLMMSTNLIIPNLTNDQEYKISISAVNTSGIESALSSPVSLIPLVTAMPDFGAMYSLQDVSDGTSSWFNSFWPILAFAVSIPLAFYISNRVKHLFIA